MHPTTLCHFANPARRVHRFVAARVLAAGLGVFVSTAALAQTPPSGASPAASALATARLDTVWLFPEREAPAVVQAVNESRLVAEAAGTVLGWTADLGDTVKKGQVLVRIDPEDARLALQRAQAQRDAVQARLRLEEAQARRARELVAQGFYSDEALNQRDTALATVRTELASAQAQWASAQRALDKTTLRAPFDGVVRQRVVQAGEAVVPGTALYVLTQLAPPQVVAQVAPADVAGLRSAKALSLVSQGRTWPVRFDKAVSALNTPERTQTVLLKGLNVSDPPLPGLSGTLRWQDTQPHLPPQYVVKRGSALGVFVVPAAPAGAPGHHVVRFVALPHAQEGRAVPVTLPADTVLVVQGQSALRDGQALPDSR